MSVKLQITVTKEILEDSNPIMCDPSNCAIAKAVHTIFPHAVVFPRGGVFITAEDAQKYITNRREQTMLGIPIPGEARKFIEEFDAGNKVEPLTFEIDIPDWIIEQMNIDEIRPLLENHPTLKLV